ncbi:hypothetical protein GQ53DRAFT_633540 [Thozetella sp. PMI_491]|nr:hypothetical protein GQ53DRAFT_633540 [Thozetella sp. PMI_491]
MDALKNLVTNVPDWLRRLDDLNGQIEQRQVELAQLTESQSPGSGGSGGSIRSVKNKGSTESLKPRDEPAAHPIDPLPSPTDLDGPQASTPKPSGPDAADPSSPAGSETPSAHQRLLTNQMKAAGQARARATLRKRQRTDSVISAEGAAPKYRTRSMIIVYYDSYVQSFFEELVKFVSASRNMMRKAKMAARVAQIKRMAELDMPESDEEDGVEQGGPIAADTTIAPETIALPALSPALKPDTPLQAATSNQKEDEEELPPLRYVSTRRMAPMTRMANMVLATGRPGLPRGGQSSSRSLLGMADSQPDVYDELDKALEYVQSMCEYAAHQFLRDGDCGEEVANIKRRLQDTKDLSDKEMERIKKEDPAALDAPPEGAAKGRSYRPQSMRRDMGASKASAQVGNPSPQDEIEVDEGIDDMDRDDMPLPRLLYKSTRAMR